MNLTEIALYGGVMVLALGAIAVIKKIAQKHGDAASQKARSEIEAQTGITLAHVYAFGQSALGFSEDARVWSLEKDSLKRLETSDVGSWYVGEVETKFLDGGNASVSNLALEDAGSDVRFANRTVKTYYALIYNNEARLIGKVGVLNEDDSRKLTSWMEKAFPGRAQDEPGDLRLYQPA